MSELLSLLLDLSGDIVTALDTDDPVLARERAALIRDTVTSAIG